MKDSRFIVTGGAGFVGSNLVAGLMAHDPAAEIVIVDPLTSGSFANVVEACDRVGVAPFAGRFIPERYQKVVADLVHDGAWTAVFHLGAITDTAHSDEASMIEENASTGWEELLEACVQRRTPLVYASSAATYGSPPQGERGEAFPVGAAGRPSNVYGWSKWLMERAHLRCEQRIRRALEFDDLKTMLPGHNLAGQLAPWIVGLRFFNVYGPCEGAKGAMASIPRQLTMQILRGDRPRLFHDGEQRRDQVHVDDVVRCMMIAAGLGSTRAPKAGIYNLGSGRATSFNEVADAVRRGVGVDADAFPTEYFDMPTQVQRFYQAFTLADMSVTADGLGFEPGVDPLDGIEAYAAYLAEQHRHGAVEVGTA